MPFLRRVEGQLDRKTTSQYVYSAASCRMWHWPSSSSRSRSEPAHRLNRGDTLIFVLLLSFGLWALIWGAVSLLGAYGLR
jgi:nitrate reductase NapE component